ncbi:MAG: hypothetical protein KR126chlam1_00007 [Chlamydiae bacterium]|nr:hypothetical protein [Chlamydiota bacterium]
MITSVSATGSPASPPAPPQVEARPFFSTEKIQTIALAFFAFFTFSLGTLAFSAGPITALFVGIPLYIGSFFIVWLILEKEEYADPEFIKSARAKAESDPLEQTIASHGWENIIRFALLSPENLLSKYKEMARYQTPQQLLNSHRSASSYIPEGSAFSLPPLSEFKDKWLIKMRSCDPWEIVNKFNLSDLVSYGICSDEEVGECNAARKVYNETKQNCRDAKKKANDKCIQTLSAKVQEVEAKLGDKWEPACTALKNLKTPLMEDEFPKEITNFFKPGETDGEEQEVYDARLALATEYRTLLATRNSRIQEAETAQTRAIQEITVDFLTPQTA